MSGERLRNALTGAVALVFAGAYIAYARGIEDSLLADAVGASGVPVAVGSLMAMAAVGLLIKAALPARTDTAAARADMADVQAPAEGPSDPREAEPSAPAVSNPHLRAAALLAVLAGYVLLLPWLGYVASMGMLVVAVALLAGGRNPKAVLGMALCTSPLLWWLFDQALKVRLPAGAWQRLLGG